MRMATKLSVLLLVVVLGQMGFDVARAAAEYPGFGTHVRFDASQADAAAEVESRIAHSNIATRWVAGQVLGFRCNPG
jgi:hypothetical protein